MDLFYNAKTVRLRSHHDKYLIAEDDEESISQDRNGLARNARWAVEFIQGSDNSIRLKSCYGKYLTASNLPFLLGMTGQKVVQSLPRRLDSSVEWEPTKDGSQVRLKTRFGTFLRANGGLPPWRKSVTHDVPHRTATKEWVVWNVDILEIAEHSGLDNKMEVPEPNPKDVAKQQLIQVPGGGNEMGNSFGSDVISCDSNVSNKFQKKEVLTIFLQ